MTTDLNRLLDDHCESVTQRLMAVGVPEHGAGAFARYIVHGISPGGFGMAVLHDSLVDAACAADSVNRHFLHAYARALMTVVPRQAWGSRENTNRWIEMGGLSASYIAAHEGGAK